MTHILIAEDSTTFQRIFKATCESIFVEASVVVCEGAQDAIEAYRQLYSKIEKPPDLVITDLNMPMKLGQSPVDEAGLVLTRVIHRIHPQVPIVVISGLKKPELVERAREVGAVSYIVKEDFRNHRGLKKKLEDILPSELFRDEPGVLGI